MISENEKLYGRILTMPAENRDWIFYHALYHLVTHWAAFMATLGLMVTITTVLSTVTISSLDSIRRRSAQLVVLMTVLGSWYFLWRMYTYSSIVNRMLPASYLAELTGVGVGPYMTIPAALATLVLGGASFRLLVTGKIKSK